MTEGKRWVLSLAVGPVGAFIGGGRRSRDLWWGSTWVSECTRAVAEKVSEEAELILPTLWRLAEVHKRYKLDGEDPMTYGGRVSNKVLAVVPAASAEEVAKLARRCEDAAHKKMAHLLNESLERLKSRAGKLGLDLAAVLEEGVFRDQVEAVREGDFVEFYAAWTPVTGKVEAALERAGRLLAARKAARLFEAPRASEDGRRKSALDAGRDTVLRSAREADREMEEDEKRRARAHLARKRLGLRPDEDLDAVSLARRLAWFDPKPDLLRLPFPPLSRVALDPWLHGVARDPQASEVLAQIRQILHQAADPRNGDPLFHTWCSWARDPENAPWDPHPELEENPFFPYDAAFLTEGEIPALIKEIERVAARAGMEPDLKRARENLEELRPQVAELHKHHGVPPPYYALLAMDGDGVGHALTRAPDVTSLKARAEALDGFADEAEKTLRRCYKGCAFYVGGDDLMAYLPLDQALGAARELAGLFVEKTEVAFGQGEVTLSAGLVIAHIKEDLRHVRRQAQDALRGAKEARRRRGGGISWLEVRYLPRGGAPRYRTDPLGELAGNLAAWQELLRDERLSLRSAHQLELLCRRFEDKRAEGRGRLGLELARHSLLARMRRSEKKSPELEERAGLLRHWRDAADLAAELILAERLRTAADLRPGNPSEGGEEAA